MKIGSTDLSSGATYVIAELSANHAGDFDLAAKTVAAIAETGANAIKLQTYTADSMTLDIDTPEFMANPNGPWAGRRLYDLYQEAMTPWEWHKPLKDIAQRHGLDFLSSPFSLEAVDQLDDLGCVAFKIASFEISDIALIRYAAQKGLPMIISTGIAEKEDIQLAVDTCRQAGNNDIVLLKCTSSYPTLPEDANLRGIAGLAETYGTFAGLSDHTLGSVAPIAAVSLGAKVIEKHVMLDHSVDSVDASFSLTVAEFKDMVTNIRFTEKALGSPEIQLTEKARESRCSMRSLYITKDIKTGEIITDANIKSIRPGYGLAPRFLPEIIGKAAARPLRRGEPVAFEMFKPSEAGDPE